MTDFQTKVKKHSWARLFLGLFLLIQVVYFWGGCYQPLLLNEERPYSPFAVIKESEEVAVVVDVELAQRRREVPYFPLVVKIANKDLYSLTIDRESLILVDSQDDIYLMPDVQELRRNYPFLAADHKFKSQTGLLGDQLLTSFSYYQRAWSNFFPQTQGAARVVDVVRLRRKSYLVDLIYFPWPKKGLKSQTLRLRLLSPELAEPFEIRFRVLRTSSGEEKGHELIF